MRRRVVVVDAYSASREDPLAVRAGDRVIVGRRDDTYPGWVWCTGPDGREGWTPEAFLERREPGAADGPAPRVDAGQVEIAFAGVDYDARELTVEAGDELLAIDEVGGWLLCEAGEAGRGWVPAAVVAPLAHR